MCHLLPYKSHTCAHRWVHLAQPCTPNMTFASAPAGHAFTRPTTILGSTQWYPAAPKSCPDCDKQGNYDGNTTRIYLGKGAAGKRAGMAGLWGPYGNGFWGGRVNAGQGGVVGWGGGGYVPGTVAVMGQGGYDWNGNFMGGARQVKPPKGPPRRYPGSRGGLLGCLGI